MAKNFGKILLGLTAAGAAGAGAYYWLKNRHNEEPEDEFDDSFEEDDFELDEENLEITAIYTAKTEGQTGVEMEALTGVNVALLTIYDMCKAIDKSMELTDIHLVEKSGGKSGLYRNPKE